MFDAPHPFLQLTLPRILRCQKRVAEMIWSAPRPVRVFYSGSSATAIRPEEAGKLEYREVELPFAWGRMLHTAWFKLELPAVENGEARYLRWVDQGEGTLYWDGVPYGGFDVAHRVWKLPNEGTEALLEGLCLQSGIWHPAATGVDEAGSRLSVAEVVERNEEAWQAAFDLEVLTDLVRDEAERQKQFGGLPASGVGRKPPVEAVSPLLRRLLRLLDDAVNAFDAGGLSALRAKLEEGREALRGAAPLVQAALTGHAHIDLVWLWTEAAGEYKARHTFASMLRLMEEYPEFHFAYSQSASYQAVQRFSPQLFAQVRERMAGGRWEAPGATYVESDTLLACGEALARSFLLGQERFRELCGESSRLLWLPDVFGYCGCLPQIMRQCGVDRFFTTKLTWSNVHLFPYSSFRWRGTDGSEVLTHVTQGLGYNQNATPGEVRQAAEEYRQSDVHGEFLMPTGFGDGGGGVTAEMCERVRRMADLAGLPTARWGRLEDFYDRLEEVRAKLPVYVGELYLEYHRGTFTTHSDLKRDFRATERALQMAEAAHVLARSGPVREEWWERIIFAQFHDYIPGSSIWEVYEQGLPELRRVASEALAEVDAQLGGGNLPANLLPLPRPVMWQGEVVELPPLSVCDPSSLPTRPTAAVTQEGRKLRSSRVEMELTATGEISSLAIDGRQLCPSSGSLHQLVLYPDFPHQFDAWDIDRQTLHLGQPVDTAVKQVEWEPGEGAVGLAFRRAVGTRSSVEIRYYVDARHPVLQCELLIDWQEENALLKAHFPTDFRGSMARFGSPFNSVLRGQLPGDTRNEAMFEVCGSRWAMVMDDSQTAGLALMTEAKFGFSCRDGDLAVTLLRAVEVTGEDCFHAQVLTKPLRDGAARQRFSDQGQHQIRYAISACQANLPRGENPAALADLLYAPVCHGAQPATAGFLGLSGGESVIPCWAKPQADGSWTLRLHETLGQSGATRLHLEPGWQACLTNLAETECGGTLRDGALLPFRPYEILSLKLQPSA